jgi:hypothetical protein
MWELLQENPWLVIVCLGLLIPITGIVFGTITGHMTRVRQIEVEAGLKQEMLQRGMSAEDIKTVIEASGRGRGKSCRSDGAFRESLT